MKSLRVLALLLCLVSGPALAAYQGNGPFQTIPNYVSSNAATTWTSATPLQTVYQLLTPPTASGGANTAQSCATVTCIGNGAQAVEITLNSSALTGGSITILVSYDGTNFTQPPPFQVLGAGGGCGVQPNPINLGGAPSQTITLLIAGAQVAELVLTAPIKGAGSVSLYSTLFPYAPTGCVVGTGPSSTLPAALLTQVGAIANLAALQGFQQGMALNVNPLGGVNTRVLGGRISIVGMTGAGMDTSVGGPAAPQALQVQGVLGGTSIPVTLAGATDLGTFTTGTTGVSVTGGYYQTTPTTAPCTTGKACAVQITQYRAQMVDLWDSSGTEAMDATNHAAVVVGKGTAGTATGGVVTVQGVASMTPVATTLAPSASSTVGITPVVSAAAESSHVLKASGGNLYSIYVTTGAVSGFLMVFNAASAPADGAVTPIECIQVAANSTWGNGSNGAPPDVYSTGITAVFSTTGCFTKTASATAFFKGRVQ